MISARGGNSKFNLPGSYERDFWRQIRLSGRDFCAEVGIKASWKVDLTPNLELLDAGPAAVGKKRSPKL